MSVSRLAGIAATAVSLSVATPAAADVTLINVFEVPEGQTETVIAAWERARDFLMKEPGYIDTALHRSVSPGTRFALINVARWESAAAFKAATQRMREARVFPQMEGLGVNPALYRVIRTDETAD